MSLREETAEKPDFDAQMRAAEEAAGIPTDEELYGPAFSAPEPDEAGRVPASRAPDEVVAETPVEAEEAAVEEPVVEEAPADEVEESEAVPMQVPLDEVAELKRKMGELLNDNAELRRWQQEQEEQRLSAQQQYVEPGSFERMLEEDPAQAIYLARDRVQYDRALYAWHDVDPVAAGRFERQTELAQLQAAMEAKIAPQLQAAEAVSQNARFAQSLEAVKSRHDDFEQVMAGVDAETADRIAQSAFPVEILPQLVQSPEGAEKVLETIYRFVKSEQTGVLVEKATEAVVAQREDAKAAKRAATVASSTTTASAPVEESEGERLARVWQETRPNMRKAWEGRS